MLKLPKSYHPDFAQPKRKPTGAFEIDWGNPIARGLTRLVAVDGLYDPANKSQLTTYGTQQKIVDLYGSGRSFASGSGLLCGTSSPHNGSFTVMAVAKPTSFPMNGNIVGCHSDLSSLGNFQFRITTGTKLEFIPFVANAAKVVTGATTLTANKSYTLAATYDASLTVATAKVFVNGVQDAALNVTGAMDTDAAALAIGARYRYANGTAPSDYFTGNIYFVLMFDRALSAREIRSLSDNPYQILKPANDFYYFPPTGGGGGGTTHEASVSFAQSCGVTVGSNAVINADASFAQAFGMSQGGAGSFNCDAEMGFLINSIAQSVADVNAQISTGIASSSIAEATAITNADAVINIAHGTVAAGGLSLSAVAEFAVSHAIQTDSDISIEALADFGMSCGLLCTAITEANAEISIDVLHNAVAETVAIIHAQAAYGITSGLSVTRTIVTDAGITCSITSSFGADGALQVEGVITTPAGRTMKILAENRTMRILLENRTMKILGDNNAN